MIKSCAYWIYASQGRNISAGGTGWTAFDSVCSFTAVKRGQSEYVCLRTG